GRHPAGQLGAPMYRLFAVALPLLAACGPGGLDGTIDGISLGVREAAFHQLKDGAGNVVGLEMLMTDQSGLCASLQAQKSLKSSTTRVVPVREFSGGAFIAPTAGDFTVPTGSNAPTKFAAVFLSKLDPNCGTAAFGHASDGKVTVSEIKAEANGMMKG